MPAPPPPRDTTTGAVFEEMVPRALKHGGYSLEPPHQLVGNRPGGRKHYVDLIASKDGRTILVSLKWQQSDGTTEQKVPFEVICLAEAIRASSGRFAKAYVVLGGQGWTLRE